MRRLAVESLHIKFDPVSGFGGQKKQAIAVGKPTRENVGQLVFRQRSRGTRPCGDQDQRIRLLWREAHHPLTVTRNSSALSLSQLQRLRSIHRLQIAAIVRSPARASFVIKNSSIV